MTIVDYRDFFRIFLCKDVDDLKARLSFLALRNIERKEYYEVGDSWIEDDALRKKVLKKMLALQQDLLLEHEYLIHSIEQYGNIDQSFSEQQLRSGGTGGLGKYVVNCFIDFLEAKKELEWAQDIYSNYPEKDEDTKKDVVPYSDDFIKKWLKKRPRDV